jgi:hypothetical protein
VSLSRLIKLASLVVSATGGAFLLGFKERGYYRQGEPEVKRILLA